MDWARDPWNPLLIPGLVAAPALDGRNTRHATYAVSQRLRKLAEQIFGWTKTVGLLRKTTRHRGRERVAWVWTFTLAAYNLVRMRNVLLQNTS